MKTVKILLCILAVGLGMTMFVYAGIDDSPGGQLIGVVVAFSAIYVLARTTVWPKK